MALPLSFKKLSIGTTTKPTLKLGNLAKAPKMSSFSFKKIKTPAGKKPKDFNFSKFTKVKKLPKAAKVAVLKKAVKKAKNVGY